MSSSEKQFQEVDIYHKVHSGDVFQKIINDGRPAVIKECQYGDCMNKWNLDYLINRIGQESVVIHESDSSDLDFLEKNFHYQTCKFYEFCEKIGAKSGDETRSVYLRSTSKSSRDAKNPARIENDFSSLKDDLRPAEFIPFGSANKFYHSSILRIASSNLQIWTHFDIYNNVLCQIHGTKRVILFPPSDARYLYIQDDKSLVNDFDNWTDCERKFPLIAKTRPIRCTLRAGESLYIPALWWHNIRTIRDDNTSAEGFDATGKNYSIGFNIFWKDEQIESKNFYAKNDIYGNKNLMPFDFALTNLDKALSHLDKLPQEYADFYKIMLFDRLKSKLVNLNLA